MTCRVIRRRGDLVLVGTALARKLDAGEREAGSPFLTQRLQRSQALDIDNARGRPPSHPKRAPDSNTASRADLRGSSRILEYNALTPNIVDRSALTLAQAIREHSTYTHQVSVCMGRIPGRQTSKHMRHRY